MTDPYSNPPLASVEPVDYDDPLPAATVQRGPQPVRVRLADAMDDALRSPRWDHVRGLALLLVGAAVAIGIAVVLVSIAVAGTWWWVQTLIEGVG